MKIKNYQLFYDIVYGLNKRLGDNNPNKDIKIKLSRLNNDVKIYGILVYDDDIHSGFRDKIHKDFNYLHNITYDHFLFFALFKDDNNVNNEVGILNKWYDILAEDKDLLLHPNDRSCETTSISSIFSLLLGIHPNEFPLLLLSTNLEEGDWIIAKTHDKIIHSQFFKVGELANEYHQQNIKIDNTTLRKDLSSKLKDEELTILEPFDKEVNINRVVADSLFFLAEDQEEVHIRRRKDQHKKKLEAFISDLEKSERLQVSDVIDTEIEPLFRSKVLKYLLINNNKKSTSALDNQDLECLYKDWLHDGTRIYIKTFLYLKKIALIEGEEEFDYSCFTIFLVKALENELNLSFINWLRFKNGITMPDFYNRYQPDKSISINNIELNQRKNQSLKYPMLGQSLSALKQFIKNDGIPTTFNNETEYEKFINELFAINDSIRIPTTHANGILTLENLKSMEEMLKKSFCTDYEQHFRGIKNILLGIN